MTLQCFILLTSEEVLVKALEGGPAAIGGYERGPEVARKVAVNIAVRNPSIN